MKPEFELDAAYVRQIKNLIIARDAFIRAHPEADIKVQFNFPRSVMMIAVATEALEKKIIVANEAGTELIHAMCKVCPDGATVFMVRMALEFEHENWVQGNTIVFEKPYECPICGKNLDLCAPVERGNNEHPQPGDLNLCWGCGGYSVFQFEGMKLLTDTERAQLPQDIREQLDDLHEKWETEKQSNHRRKDSGPPPSPA